MKKNLRYYLLMAALMVVVSMSAQMNAQEPVVTMSSTSSMVGSGSSLPSAAVGGSYTSYGEYGSPSALHGPRRAFGGDEEDEDGGSGNLGGGEGGGQNPDGPIGAMPWVMMAMMVAGYALLRRRRSTMHGNRAA